MDGWIKLNRQITEHWLWKDEPFDKARAWIDLLLLANHEEHKTIYEGKLIICKRGEVNRSISWLANRWQWNRKTVRKFLSILESDEMVVVDTTTHWTTITIVNWDIYQVDGTTKRTTKGTTTGQPRDTYKNDKNEKNNSNNVFVPPTLDEIAAYCKERNNDVNPKQFFDYFETGHWVDSEGKPVRNWKQKLITWEKKGRKPQPKKTNIPQIESHDYDFNELERILSQ